MNAAGSLRIEASPGGRADPALFAEVAARVYGSALPEDPVPGDAECLSAWRGTTPLARCALHLADELQGAPGRSGLVGHYEALEPQAGVAVLDEACRRLFARGAGRVLGPMNGSTWRRYRLALAPPEPPFFLGEPRNPPGYPEHFRAAGFAECALYESRIDDDVGAVPADAADLARDLEAPGIRVRRFDPDRFDQEVDTLYDLCVVAFAENLYYSPIDRAGFRALYDPVRGRVDPDLVHLAEDERGDPVAFLFAYADPGSGPEGRRVVAKTLATIPRVRGLGIARHLFDRLYRAAFAKGYRSMIHALMHVENRSMAVSARHGGRLFRRYALYQRNS